MTQDILESGGMSGVASPTGRSVADGRPGSVAPTKKLSADYRRPKTNGSPVSATGSRQPAERRGQRPLLVFWDWNGTLLDDRDYAIGVRNRVFPRFGLPRIGSLADYYDQFTFPVRLYYERAGVTDENFVEIAHAWMDEYVRGADSIPLRADAMAALSAFQAAGISQVVLSASNTEILRNQLEHYDLMTYFTDVLGLSHIYASSKQAIGETYLRNCAIPPENCVLLGDTLHDAEVAREMGIDCILIADGHQCEAKLRTAGCPVCASLTEAVERVLGGDL